MTTSDSNARAQRHADLTADQDQTAAEQDQTAAEQDQTAAEQDQTAAEQDQMAADLDQMAADLDQMAADQDHAASEADRALADRDQQSSDRDQIVSDWEHAHARDAVTRAEAAWADEAYEASRAERYETSRERDQTAAGRAQRTADRLVAAAQRDEVARLRDLNAAERDRAAQARDDAADARDRSVEARERQAIEDGDVDPSIFTLRALRVASAAMRSRAAIERAAAAHDREAAAADRRRAAADRQHAGLDELTGVFRRASGELALLHEIDRSRRLHRSLVLAMIDVDALKLINDNEGHAAGDALLRDVPTAIAQTLRSYDITVRWGGDEFVCALSEVTLDTASERFAQVQRMLETLRPGASISVGLAELSEDDTLESLTARADAELYLVKSKRRG